VGKPTGFIEESRTSTPRRPVELRLRDWREVYETQSNQVTETQASRCMDCGIPFCHQGCPLGNLIPEWNDLVYKQSWKEAHDRLQSTNNFPEFTGRLCPAPCESACVVGISGDAVTIERIELEIVERAFSKGWITPQAPMGQCNKSVAIVGSGPAGLAAAQQLQRHGYQVTIFDRQEMPGGLLRFGIPEFKMEKHILDRRLDQMIAEGVEFRTNTEIDADALIRLRSDFDAVVLAIGSTIPRKLDLDGSGLSGILPAMEYLKPANITNRPASHLDANGKDVIILGGGDTGADCLGTAHRQGARSVTQLEILPQPPVTRRADQPWPTMPQVYKITSAHEEGGQRIYSASTERFIASDNEDVSGLEVRVDGTLTVLPADLVLVAAGFVGPETEGLLSSAHLNTRGCISVDVDWLVEASSENLSPLFACGDAVRGQSLIVWAIAEGRAVAASVDEILSGSTSNLPSPVQPYQLSW